MADLVIKNGWIVTPQGIILGGIAVTGERISYIGDNASLPEAGQTIDAENRYVIPGLIDPHVHITAGLSSGQAEEELFQSETLGGAFGGVTCYGNFVASPGEESLLPQVEAALETAQASSYTDCFFHCIVGSSQAVHEEPELFRRFGVASFKHFYNAYKARPGDPQRLPYCESDRLYQSLSNIAKLGSPAIGMAHCEDQDVINVLEDQLRAKGRTDLRSWAESRPGWVEVLRIRLAFEIARATGAPLYVVHMSAAEGVDLMKEHREQGFPFWGETCPHYLTHDADMEEEIGCWGKVNTPIRWKRDSDRLWRGMVDGGITNIGTDHCSYPRATKEAGKGKYGNIWDAGPGINGGMEHLLSVLLTFGVLPGRITIEDMVRLTSTNNAKVFGLYPRKGVLAIGSEADIVIVDTEQQITVGPDFYHCAGDWGIYFDWKLRGGAKVTILRGQIVMQDGKVLGKPGYGKYLRRGNPQQAS